MSMNAVFVQVEPAELSGFEADPSLVEALFNGDASAAAGAAMPGVTALTKAMQDRVRTTGPQAVAELLSRLPPELRKQVEERLGRLTSALAAGEGGDEILNLMQQRLSRTATPAPSRSAPRSVLSLDKNWHGVHYVLCGAAEPGTDLLSQAVLGGTALGDDDEGFSGYGPARSFTVAQVGELSRALSRPDLESEAAARFNAARMSELGIYPGWRVSDAADVTNSVRRLRDFYTDAAQKGRAIVTCLV